jgi:hypothetical protein
MPNQPLPRSTVDPSFTPQEWELLVRLPGQVLVAAATAERGSAPLSVPQGLAGMEAIAAGRGSPSRLVRHVVSAIYAEPGTDEPGTAGRPTPAVVDESRVVVSVYAECRAACRAVDSHSDPAEATAYRAWLLDIANAVCAPAAEAKATDPAKASRTPASARGVAQPAARPTARPKVTAGVRRFLNELSRGLKG